jgi:hypothetical protein
VCVYTFHNIPGFIDMDDSTKVIWAACTVIVLAIIILNINCEWNDLGHRITALIGAALVGVVVNLLVKYSSHLNSKRSQIAICLILAGLSIMTMTVECELTWWKRLIWIVAIPFIAATVVTLGPRIVNSINQ